MDYSSAFRKLRALVIALSFLARPQSVQAQNVVAGPVYTNHLIRETSPYLLLHAHNPVDWYPWSAEAFEKARREQKPIFLSIGYYTCHWCHVMEQESYSNPEIAKILNQFFVAIKVDREERPAVDRLYIAYLEALMPNAGWPANVVLTPDLKPFLRRRLFCPRTAYEDSFEDCGRLVERPQSLHAAGKPSRTAACKGSQPLPFWRGSVAACYARQGLREFWIDL